MNSILRSLENVRPADIERRSMEIIESEIGDTSALTPEQKLIVKRVIHTTADFDFLNIMRFSENATDIGLNALKNNAVIVTDTQMALSGISKPALNALGCEAVCFMSDPKIAIDMMKENEAKIKEIDPSYAMPDVSRFEKKKGGCYIATAVYGSYDCPEVWTLRRYRDHKLARSLAGRTFIRAYYAISPTLVKWFSDAQWFKTLGRLLLDDKVARLKSEGFKDTPYSD